MKQFVQRFRFGVVDEVASVSMGVVIVIASVVSLAVALLRPGLVNGPSEGWIVLVSIVPLLFIFGLVLLLTARGWVILSSLLLLSGNVAIALYEVFAGSLVGAQVRSGIVLASLVLLVTLLVVTLFRAYKSGTLPLSVRLNDVDSALDSSSDRIRPIAGYYERLRRDTLRTRRVGYRLSGAVIVAIGIAFGVGSVVLPQSRVPLLILSGIGLYLGVFAYGTTPANFVSTDLCESIYLSTLSDRTSRADTHVYEPVPGPMERDGLTVRVQSLSDEDRLAPDGDSISLHRSHQNQNSEGKTPTGEAVLDDFEIYAQSDNGSRELLIKHLLEIVTDGFELVSQTTLERHEPGQAVVVLTESTIGRIDRPDHPAVSILGVGLALITESPVSTTVEQADEGSQWRITLEWTPD